MNKHEETCELEMKILHIICPFLYSLYVSFLILDIDKMMRLQERPKRL